MYGFVKKISNTYLAVLIPTFPKHIKNIFLSKEQDENSVCRFSRHTGPDGKNYNIWYYNKEMGMSIGFKINSEIAIEFRKWAIEVINSGLANEYAPFHLKIPFNA